MTTDLKAQILEKLELKNADITKEFSSLCAQIPLKYQPIITEIAKLGGRIGHNTLAKEIEPLLSDPNVFIGRWESMESAPKGVPVLVRGGIAKKKTGDEWFTGMEEPLYQRRIEWDVKAWAHLPPAPEEKE